MGANEKLIHRRFTKDEYKQLRTIFSEESKVMMKRPGYIVGNILMIVMLFYFLVCAFDPESLETFERPTIETVIGAVVGGIAGTFVYWLLLKRTTPKGSSLKLAVVFWGVWMFFFFLFTNGQADSEAWVNWEFAIYAAATLFGWLFCTGSIKEHFCEKIFMARKEGRQV